VDSFSRLTDSRIVQPSKPFPVRWAILGLALISVAASMIGQAASGWDHGLLSALYAGHRPAVAQVAALLTDLGGGPFLLVVTALAAGAFWILTRRLRPALTLLAATLAGRVLVEVQKWALDRPRPSAEGHLVSVQSMSFPSGHAANATITYLAIALIAAPLLPSRGWRTTAVGTALLLAAAIGVSRIMLGVHWPSDVYGGWAFGLVWTLAVLEISRYSRDRP